MKKLEFRKSSDHTVYKFSLSGEYNGKPKYLREDKNIIIAFLDQIGWCVLDEKMNQVSWPDKEFQDLQAKFPPACKWISRKEGKSYSYDLVPVN